MEHSAFDSESDDVYDCLEDFNEPNPNDQQELDISMKTKTIIRGLHFCFYVLIYVFGLKNFWNYCIILITLLFKSFVKC